ncbi:MAG: hypothetical protein MRZ75_12970 [Roseburia sp.]|uniref:hypothetical protein n=1 Tax=Roseburia sp. 831b TaxID=1261635 RepID=UPI001FA92718|nr:hypothetical protein [Roseburia sp. 831b]MCI5920214.1 hypothetical protein [Roseburia sp.]MDD6216015.1 hypothetical protein [Roseburia sp.]WVK72026.1 hypothetical protein BIV16_09520 [Roseburia sp. 831b]
MSFNMVNEERLRHMIKMETFEKHDGKACKPMAQYARRDYVSMQMLRSLITGTITYVIMLVMWAVYEMERLMEEITGMDIQKFVGTLLLLYVVFMVVYEIATYLVFQMKYSSGRKKVKQYYSCLKKVNRMYEREDRLKGTSTGDWQETGLGR